MRIKVIQSPRRTCIDGIRLDHFVLGHYYDVGNLLAAYLVAEGWAEPAEPAAATRQDPLSELSPDLDPAIPRNLIRESYPPYYEGLLDLALDRRKRRRSP